MKTFFILCLIPVYLNSILQTYHNLCVFNSYWWQWEYYLLLLEYVFSSSRLVLRMESCAAQFLNQFSSKGTIAGSQHPPWEVGWAISNICGGLMGLTSSPYRRHFCWAGSTWAAPGLGPYVSICLCLCLSIFHSLLLSLFPVPPSLCLSFPKGSSLALALSPITVTGL